MKYIFRQYKFLMIAMQFVLIGFPLAGDLAKPICIDQKVQNKPVAISRAVGSGAFIAWEDNRNTTTTSNSGNGDIYAQLLCGCDSASWVKNGVPICTAPGEQLHPVLANDTSGGMIIAWEDHRNGLKNIYAQKVDRKGDIQWAVDGIAVSATSSDPRNVSIVADRSGGAIIVWEDKRSEADSANIFAQRISGNGTMEWGPSGRLISKKKSNQSDPRLICNTKGGVIVTWQDDRSGNSDIYAQAMDSMGIMKWDTNGVAICAETSAQTRPRMVSDGAEGAIVVWNDLRSTTYLNIFAQRIDGNGQVKWDANGVVLNNNMAGDQFDPVIEADRQGGAIIVWSDSSATNVFTYGQRINSSGKMLWASTGVAIASVVSGGIAGAQLDPQIVGLYRGGASIAWVDHRNTKSNIYTQMISADGAIMSDAGGQVISPTVSDQINPVMISDGNEGYIAFWQDFRNSNSDIYYQINPLLTTGIHLSRGSSSRDNSVAQRIKMDPFGRITYVVENPGNVKIELIDMLGHHQSTLMNAFQLSGSYSIPTQDIHTGNKLHPGIYFCRFIKNGNEQLDKIIVTR